MKTIWLTLNLLLLICANSNSQKLNYGLNEKNGKYANTGDANIYYEVYGEGRPVVLLHGGYAYIDQFKDYIPILSKKYKVIAIAQRGYGKSEIGSKPFSHELCVDDIKAVIKKESREKAIIIGFSSGANLGYLTAYRYPEIVHKLVVMGGVHVIEFGDEDKEPVDVNELSQTFEYYRPDFKKIMPQPERWDEFIENMARMWSRTTPTIPPGDLKKIKSPVLLLFGDRDSYCKLEFIVKIYESLPNAQLAIFPDSGHLDVSPFNTALLDQYILKFIE